MLKDILKNDTRARSPAGQDSGPISYQREHSLYSNSAGAGGRKDATVYKFKDDEAPAGGFYQPRSRHVDRSAIRTTSETASPAADLDDIKRELDNTSKMLDRVVEADASRTAEDDALAREMADLRARIRRVNDDLAQVSSGPRSAAKDEERRRLDRELMDLRHSKLPDLERRIEDREARREREKREWTRERDRRNERHGRYDDRDDRYSSSRYDRDRDYDRPRSAYDRDDRGRDDRDSYRDTDRDYDRDRPYSSNRDRDYDRPRSPPAAREPAPPPPPPPATSSASARSPPPAPSTQKKVLTSAERTALAQQRIRERMAALGVVAPSPSPTIDTTVEDRLAQEKREAEEKARQAELEVENRERLRRERLEGEKALKEGRTPTSPTTAPAPAAPAAPTPAPPKAKPPAPPPPRKGAPPRPPAHRAPPTAPAPPVVAPAPPAPPAAPAVDPEEEAIRAREEVLRKTREERLARLKQLEREEEEARLAEQQYEARRRMLSEQAQQRNTPPLSTPPVVAAPPPAPPAPPVHTAPQPPVVPAAPPPPPAPPAPPVVSPPASTPSSDKSTNPFSRMVKEGTSVASSPAPAPPATGSHNPFFKSQAAASPAAPPFPQSSASPAPPAVKTPYHTAPADDDDDWDDVKEKEDEDSSEDELDSSSQARNKLAQQLFGSLIPPSRPQSAAASGPVAKTSEPSSPAPPPPPPPPPSAPPMTMTTNTFTHDIPAPPPAPPAPGAPPAPPAPAAIAVTPTPSGDRGALLNAIQAGKKLRKAQTNDRSAAPVSGTVIGDTAPPAHINAAPRAPSPPAPAPAPEPVALPPLQTPRNSNRESVDWYAGLAVEGASLQRYPSEPLPPTVEEVEDSPTAVPEIQVEGSDDNALADVDHGTGECGTTLYSHSSVLIIRRVSCALALRVRGPAS